DDDKSFRRAPSWRKKFRPKDVRGFGASSADTLPASFRVASSSTSPAMQPKKHQLDGTHERDRQSPNKPHQTLALRLEDIMWKAVAGRSLSVTVDEGADDWETDPDFENDVTEKEQRWGAKTVEGSGHQEHINHCSLSTMLSSIHKLREKVSSEHNDLKQKELENMPQASHGYGGKFGVQEDRMDKSAVGHDYQSKLSKHCSQTDTSKGFGGKFGVQSDRVDQSAVGFEYAGKTEKHASQKDYATGFGGRYGVQADRVDQSAVGFDYQGKIDKHESQKDYTKGFGGKFGVETDKVDKSAVGFEYQGKTEKHESQKDYVKGFGGKFGVQTDRQDKSAVGWDHQEKVQLHESQKDYKRGFGGKYGVEVDKQDKCALGFDHKESLAKHESQQGTTCGPSNCPSATEAPRSGSSVPTRVPQLRRATASTPSRLSTPHSASLSVIGCLSLTDYSKGFGGKYGVEKDRMDKSAGTFEEVEKPRAVYQKTRPVEAGKSVLSAPNILGNDVDAGKSTHAVRACTGGSGTSSIKARFENLAKEKEEEDKKRAQEERARRQATEKQEQEQARKNTEDSAKARVPSPQPGPVSKAPDFQKTVLETENLYEVEPDTEPTCEQPAEEPLYQNQNLEPALEGRYQATDSPSYEYGEDLGVTAVALYDYQAAGDDEISFDPDDIITNIEMIDEGWWRGVCRGAYGLFPANYVEVRQ
ncbi:hypothetical protein P4O66_018595, partial [Electrophorus voltai]